MAMDRIQFQKGMSITDLHERFGTEAACERVVFQARWADGFVCPKCQGRHASQFVRHGRRFWQCSDCRRQTSLVAGTLFEHTRLPLTTWFQAIYLITQSKNNVSALELKRYLGVSYRAAWRIKHKLMDTMKDRESKRVLEGYVQADDAYLGGERAGKPGRGSENKVPFVAAVEVNEHGHPLYLRLDRVPSFDRHHVGLWGQEALDSSTHLTSDGLNSFKVVAERLSAHERIICGGGRAAAKHPQFKWVNTILGNLKTAIAGTYHAFKFKKYGQRYLAVYAYRFNRRFDMAAMVDRLAIIAVRSAPRPEKALRVAERWY